MVEPEYTTGRVTSADGVEIGYRQLGSGPGLIVLHGSMEAAHSHMQLARALADAYTVYLPDRRGRGASGPYPSDYGMATELADLDALLATTGARNVFGVSASGLVVLEAARTRTSIDRVIAYEPAFLCNGPVNVRWLPKFDREIADGRVSRAMITSMKGLRLGPRVFDLMPEGLLAKLTDIILNSEDKHAQPGDITSRMLAPTVHYEAVLLGEMNGPLDGYADVKAEVLLLGGGRGLPFLKPALDVLERTLPRVRRVEFDGLDHGGSADVSKANPKGKPEVIAAEIRRFLDAD